MINPYSTKENLESNYNFLVSDNNFLLQRYINVLCVYYNTPIYHKMKSEGLLTANYSYDKIYEYVPKEKSIEKIIDFIKNYFAPFSKIMKEYIKFTDNVHFYYFTKTLVESISSDDDLNINIQKIFTDISITLKNYFYKLYLKKDIDDCIKDFPSFEEELLLHFHSFEKIKNKSLLPKYIKFIH